MTDTSGPVPRVEDYALIGDLHTAALVDSRGSMDWLCLPRFDAPSCFARLLGRAGHGRWLLAPSGHRGCARRRYRPGTLVLETTFEGTGGTVRIVDFMPLREEAPRVIRIVEGVAGTVEVAMELILRFDYGAEVPWVRRVGPELLAVAGPDAVVLRTPVATRGEDLTTVASFRVSGGDVVPFELTWFPSHTDPPPPIDAPAVLEQTERWWREWAGRSSYDGDWAGAVERSLLTLKALTYSPTGGIVAAPTTSLPEALGGVRNWDYRYCWLRDATFTLYALLSAGYTEEAVAWRDWLLRATAGDPASMQIMYGVAGERRLPEVELDWLPGFAASRPVRIGNAAAGQFQLDVYGEVMDTLHVARRAGMAPEPAAWDLQLVLLEFLESAWRQPDEGIWEVRGPRRHFTHSKVMAWVAFDRAVRAVETFGHDGPAAGWRAQRDEVHREVCERGYDPVRNTFTQFYGSESLDAALLLMSHVGFLPAGDPRLVGTIAAVQRELGQDGLLRRYGTSGGDHPVDGLPGTEGLFLPCSFWLADNLALLGRDREARGLFERLLGLGNDVGLLAEEYDPDHRRQLGNFPQAFTHLALINTAHNLSSARLRPAAHRSHHADVPVAQSAPRRRRRR